MIPFEEVLKRTGGDEEQARKMTETLEEMEAFARRPVDVEELVEKAKDFTGDGKSWQTAIFFNAAKADWEHIQLQYMYLNQHGIKLELRLCFEGKDPSCVYDLHVNAAGKIWFKVPKSGIKI